MTGFARYDDLDGASVFITGGGTGIGAALTTAFLEQGARVAFVDLADCRDAAAMMAQATGNTPLFIQCDVTDTQALHNAMDQAAAAHGPFKATINNAANDMRMPAATVTEAEWAQMIDVNLKHYFFASQKAAALMGDGGSIINFSSISYMMGGKGMAPYVTSNAGITGMTRALAREWGPQGLRVNAIAPGWVLTDKQMEKWATPETLAAFLDLQCLKRHLKPEDVVGTALFLASDSSAMMTSQVLVVDAGVVVTG
ncbi:SDR family NAD(P)-dependent oxidoreductase [Yoonia sp. R2331]|uniref:SDR family NAD(P)-dependent oxidoreductase n=1 Tax=Yoonia sp. R2331 TaxID=3237238 RepID=UPI0034E42AB8